MAYEDRMEWVEKHLSLFVIIPLVIEAVRKGAYR